jgi:hypothetical protein
MTISRACHCLLPRQTSFQLDLRPEGRSRMLADECCMRTPHHGRFRQSTSAEPSWNPWRLPTVSTGVEVQKIRQSSSGDGLIVVIVPRYALGVLLEVRVRVASATRRIPEHEL